MTDIFLTATDARAKAQNYQLIFTEVTKIEQEILTAISNGLYSINVQDTAMTDTTPTTDSILYFQVWKNQIIDSVKQDQMNKVITYFTNLGYQIVQVMNTNSTTFYWQISW